MRLPLDTILAPEKFREYLLKKLPENDKSAFLSVAGYTLEDWQRLAEDIRSQILPLDATLGRETVFGTMYEIRGVLVGPNGRRLAVVTVWMIEAQSRNTKFITLFPDKESQYGI